MAKMRVHELAKELNIKSQDILDKLKNTKFDGKSASSNMEEEAQALVRGAFSKEAKPAADVKKTEVAKAGATKTADGKERPKKKSSITAVFNAQYSKQSRKPANGNNNNRGNGTGNGNGNGRIRDENKRPAQHSIIRPRPVGERAMRPISERTPSPTADLEVSKPANNKPAENTNTRNSQENRGNNNHSGGERNNRPQNDRNNDRGGERNNNRHQGDRNNNNRPNGDRNNSRPQNDRNNNGRKNRFSKEPAAVAAPEEIRGKDSRGNNDRRNNNNNHRKDHDKLGGKKQENYVNLEKHGGRKKPQQQPKPKEDENVIKTITLPEKMTIRDLADKMKLQPSAIVKKLFMKGEMVTVNQEVDFETAEEIALEFNFICEPEEKIDVIAELLKEDEEDPKNLVPRPPVVCVMGHVDHGKTSLLDAIRSTRVTDREAGGITQHIGASVVSINGQKITFLDTPGHEAFTAMRMRGANSTDIAILVVAADDGVMPQTIEAINHASAAGVPIVFAINKIDKPAANPDKIKEELANMNYLVEDWGGKYQSQEISAKKGIGVKELLDKVLLEAEMLDLKANPNRKATGSIIESSLDKGRGYVATVLVSNGTLRVGDIMVAGTSYGKIRAMFNERNQRITEAGPAAPALVLGLNGAPTAGDTFNILDTDREAREIATRREQLQREVKERTRRMPGLDDIARRRALGEFHELNLIVKGDVDGSIEALSDSLIKLSTPEVQVNVIHKAVGAISESDVTLAAASDAVIIGFQVRPSVAARRLAENDGVDIRLYSIIYDAIEEVKDAMAGMLSPELKEEVTGTAEVLQTYKISKVGTIAGCMVREGKVKRTSKVRLIRDGIVIYTGELGSLKRFKDDVKEVSSGYDCGLNIANYNDVKEGDMIEAYEEVEVSKTL